MQFFRTPLVAAIAAVALVVPQVASAAPRSWMLPSETQFTGSGDEWLTVDAALSTDLYYPDHPGQAWTPVATAPDGSETPVENLTKGKLRLTFDLHITQRGTYKLSILNEGVMGSYMLNGERKPLPRGTTQATLAQAVPAGATDVWTAEVSSRIETFATAGTPTTTVFKPVGKGIEMVPVTHPNDLTLDAPATFQFLLDGKPAAGLTVSAINGGVRYANGLQQMEFTTDAQGKVTIRFAQPGMWWVSASLPQPEAAPERPAAAAAGAPAGQGQQMSPPARRATYAMTVEVLG